MMHWPLFITLLSTLGMNLWQHPHSYQAGDDYFHLTLNGPLQAQWNLQQVQLKRWAQTASTQFTIDAMAGADGMSLRLQFSDQGMLKKPLKFPAGAQCQLQLQTKNTLRHYQAINGQLILSRITADYIAGQFYLHAKTEGEETAILQVQGEFRLSDK